ncbi:hypothetical protein EMIHUDRAFT_95214 [Emiliania huxleyi CCMP1516]|uniref:LNS2/PITP domain-containing protein n=2 Tax=Emiliania huxleyi TaxID=2903 RepID=A0A0D3L205_EMIH1|nr:hypothetical protein EMIHUDRAFT_95214 [Emiliania huxleyi CCMP1516]EOD42040.1 hypothetical protein EMIHUDRAFT_95214 [Emiliania huxleyi CCMP1516]|eukprot:XP_005794469.1 hypothetical protein EMIHUDRAFT_95214 [Emiliania huxleyi CCMP1516]
MRQALSAILPDTNTATLSGAVDIIAVRSADGTLATTAWHVRFGLLKVVQSRERPVTIRVNGVEADEKSCRMVLSAAGEGRFVAGSAQKAPGVAGGSDEQALAAHPPPDWLSWEPSSRLVISDIDGTVTRSDVRGNILPAIGWDDYAHEGVAQLYTAIAARGFCVVYLSSRNIGLADRTKQYISGLRQHRAGGETVDSLPEGPVITSPSRMADALIREVAGMFYAGSLHAAFGNRPTDLGAYEAAGIPRERIFIVDKETRLAVAQQPQQSQAAAEHTGDARHSYRTLLASVEDMFPTVS